MAMASSQVWLLCQGEDSCSEPQEALGKILGLRQHFSLRTEMCRRPVVVSALRSLRHPIGLHLAKPLRPGRTRRKQRGRLRDEEEISVSMQPTHPHHPSSCADSSWDNPLNFWTMLREVHCLRGYNGLAPYASATATKRRTC